MNIESSTPYERRMNSTLMYFLVNYPDAIIEKCVVSECADMTVKLGDAILGVIAFDNEDYSFLNKRINSLRNKYNSICVLFFDSHIRANLEKSIPKNCGMLCFSNSFGNGMVHQLFRKWND